LSNLEGKEVTKTADPDGQVTQGELVLTRDSSLSSTRASTPSSLLSPESDAENLADQEAVSSEQTLHAKKDSPPCPPVIAPSQEPDSSLFPGATPSIGRTRPGNSFPPFVALSYDEQHRPRRRRRQLQGLIDKRVTALSVRLRVQESRNALRNARENLIDQDARFFQELRILAAKPANAELAALLRRNEDTQYQREEVQLQESEYNVIEDELVHLEWEMKEEETKFYEQLENADDPLALDDLGYSDKDVVYVPSIGSTASISSNLSPLKRRWLSRVGDRNMLLERLQELRGDRAYWVEEEMKRKRLGLDLDDEGHDFLASFDSRHVSLKDDLVQVEADLARLEESLSESADALYSSTQFDHEGDVLDQRSMKSSLSIASVGDKDPASNDPLFLKNDNKSPPVFANAAADSKQGSISTVSYINEWLLHILRRSAVEVRRYKTTEKIRALQLDRDELTRLVLEWWSKDETVNSFPRARNHTGRALSLTSKANETEHTRRATRSDSVLFGVDRLARRLQGNQYFRFDEHTSARVRHGLGVLDESQHATAWSF
jgi:hypothetical protein